MTREERRASRLSWLKSQGQTLLLIAAVVPLLVLCTSSLGGSISWALIAYGGMTLISRLLGNKRLAYSPALIFMIIAATLPGLTARVGGLLVATVWYVCALLSKRTWTLRSGEIVDLPTMVERIPAWVRLTAIAVILFSLTGEILVLIPIGSNTVRFIAMLLAIGFLIFIKIKKPSWRLAKWLCWTVICLTVIASVNWQAFSAQMAVAVPQQSGDLVDKLLAWVVAPLSGSFWTSIAKSWTSGGLDVRVLWYPLIAVLTLPELYATLTAAREVTGDEIDPKKSFQSLAIATAIAALVGAPLPSFSMAGVGALRQRDDGESTSDYIRETGIYLLVLGGIGVLTVVTTALVIVLQGAFALLTVYFYGMVAQKTLRPVYQPIVQTCKKVCHRAENWPSASEWWPTIVILSAALISARVIPGFYLGSGWLIKFPWSIWAIALVAAVWVIRREQERFLPEDPSGSRAGTNQFKYK